ncbi:Pentatricopeptide repeat-containing protein At2g31400 [Durusdinium trenchii]|uniref:Chloroplastic n=1 Tax=Durusdinium trenchii TaxID=1381693 RepID=A0ABP0KK03_9DINO
MPVLPLQARSRVLRLASLRHSQFLWAAARRSFSGAGPGLHLWAENARREVFARLHGLRKSKATPQEVLFIVSECQRRQLLKDPRDWVVAMSSLGHVGLWTDTLALFEAMHLETAVAVHAFNATLSAVQRAQQWEAAVALFADIERYSLTPDTVTCNALLTACDKGGQWQSALSLLERIGPTYHLQPNVVSYSTTLSACERGRAWEHALQVFANMNGCEISPDVVVFNATLSALDGGSRWEEALTLLEEMNEAKVAMGRSIWE